MAYDKIITSDVVIQRCIESQGIFQRGNRGYDSLITQGATSVRRPKLPTLVGKKNTGTSKTSADRKGTKADTIMVETPLDIYAIPIKDEIAAQFESNKKLLNEFAVSASMTMTQMWDTDFIAAAKATANVIETKSTGVVSWKDIISVRKKFRQNQVPVENGLLMVVSADVEDLVMDIDVVKQAAAYNTIQLSTGKLIRAAGFDFYFSGLVGKSVGNQKDCIVGIHGPGLASIISSEAVIKEAWDGETLADYIDFVAHAAFELDDDKFAVVLEVK